MSTVYEGKTFGKEKVDIDGCTFTDCRFEDSTLVYSGGEFPSFKNCHFQNQSWHFDGAAGKTIEFLKITYHQFTGSGPEIVNGIFEIIKRPFET